MRGRRSYRSRRRPKFCPEDGLVAHRKLNLPGDECLHSAERQVIVAETSRDGGFSDEDEISFYVPTELGLREFIKEGIK